MGYSYIAHKFIEKANAKEEKKMKKKKKKKEEEEEGEKREKHFAYRILAPARGGIFPWARVSPQRNEPKFMSHRARL